jgi:hypothetical protein
MPTQEQKQQAQAAAKARHERERQAVLVKPAQVPKVVTFRGIRL